MKQTPEAPEDSTNAVDRRSLTLIAQFRAHVEECRQQGNDADERLIFEGWMLQKIAGLQLVCAALMRETPPEEQERLIIAAEKNWRGTTP